MVILLVIYHDETREELEFDRYKEATEYKYIIDDTVKAAILYLPFRKPIWFKKPEKINDFLIYKLYTSKDYADRL